MSFWGIRDISIINTPPPGRRAIKTFIRKREDGIIREAVNREIARGGQTFFVHNSIETIGPMARHLRKILPHARMAVAHGRMNGAELEQTMEEFIKHKVDILLCTTIIESGLDIPNANTIIINRADQLGLAQLYQLRGRVGRDRHRAYAYLLVPEVLSSLAQKRISAIEELSTLGSGFRLAARDMEIRGTGNLLGAKQSGHVTAVGFETYCRMLQETVDELKTGRTTAKMETKLDLDFVGKLEEIYIKPLDQRMNYYNRLHRADSPEEIRGIRDELADRYGSLPQKARKLVQAAVLRSAGSALGIEKITVNGNLFSLTFAESCERVVEITSAAGHSFPGRIRPTGERTLQIAGGSGDDRIERITAFLEEAATQEMEAETV
jgi:transcription-repair coupling factor (superfamily II helicase)